MYDASARGGVYGRSLLSVRERTDQTARGALPELGQSCAVAGGLGRVAVQVLAELRGVVSQASTLRAAASVAAQAQELGPELALFGAHAKRPASER